MTTGAWVKCFLWFIPMTIGVIVGEFHVDDWQSALGWVLLSISFQMQGRVVEAGR